MLYKLASLEHHSSQQNDVASSLTVLKSQFQPSTPVALNNKTITKLSYRTWIKLVPQVLVNYDLQAPTSETRRKTWVNIGEHTASIIEDNAMAANVDYEELTVQVNQQANSTSSLNNFG